MGYKYCRLILMIEKMIIFNSKTRASLILVSFIFTALLHTQLVNAKTQHIQETMMEINLLKRSPNVTPSLLENILLHYQNELGKMLNCSKQEECRTKFRKEVKLNGKYVLTNLSQSISITALIITNITNKLKIQNKQWRI
jgi:hypothetical protein